VAVTTRLFSGDDVGVRRQRESVLRQKNTLSPGARVGLLPPSQTMQGRCDVRSSTSADQLRSTGDEWAWRVWSITRSGEIAFSEVRTFVH
jgi:hypothetical protein